MLALRQGQRPLGRLSNSQHALSSCSTRQTSLPKLTSSSSSSSTPSPIASSSRLPSSPRLIINRRYAAVTLVRPKRPESNEKPTSATSSPVVPSVKQDRDASADLARRRRARLASNTLVNAKRLVKQLKQKPVEQLRVDEQVEEQEKELEDEQDQNQGQAKEVELEKDHPRQIPYVRETRSSIAESPEAADLVRKRPRNPPRLETWDPEYVKPYRKVYIDIETAFTRRQLRVMSHELKFRANSKESKTVLITRILEQWGWKAPTERPKLTPGERGALFR